MGLSEPPDDEKMHRMEAAFARECLAFGPTVDQVQVRAWEPHYVYVLHVPAERLYKVGRTRHDSRRLADLTARGRAVIVQKHLVANQWAARALEGVVLELTAPARRHGAASSAHGKTEHWEDSMEPPKLAAIAVELAGDPALRHWATSR